MFLSALEKILSIRGLSSPPLCIADLVSHGLCLDRFPSSISPPSRVDIPLFISAWCKHVGLGEKDYRDWLIDYALTFMKPLSHSSPSAIRHSTQSSVRFIHQRDAAFACNIEHNALQAQCSPTCPLYGAMSELYAASEALRLQKIAEEEARQEEVRRQIEALAPDPESLPVLKRYQTQYNEAIKLIAQLLNEGKPKIDIPAILNEKGYKTSTGKVWSLSTVVARVAKHGLPAKKRLRRQAARQ